MRAPTRVRPDCRSKMTKLDCARPSGRRQLASPSASLEVGLGRALADRQAGRRAGGRPARRQVKRPAGRSELRNNKALGRSPGARGSRAAEAPQSFLFGFQWQRRAAGRPNACSGLRHCGDNSGEKREGAEKAKSSAGLGRPADLGAFGLGRIPSNQLGRRASASGQKIQLARLFRLGAKRSEEERRGEERG